MNSHRTGVRAWYVVVAVALTLLISIPHVRLYREEQPSADIVAQLRFLRSEWDSGVAQEMQGPFPEGYFFVHALYGLVWTDIARTEPAHRQEALRQARWKLEQLESPAGRAAFDPTLRPAHGVFAVGWAT